MIYDYRPKKVADDLEEIFDSLNGQQMEKVCEFLSHMRDEEEIEKALCQKVWLRDTLVFLMKNYAERTCSRLEIREKDTDFCVALQNDIGFVLTEDRGRGAAILMADYAVVERRQGEIQILLTYSCESRNTR